MGRGWGTGTVLVSQLFISKPEMVDQNRPRVTNYEMMHENRPRAPKTLRDFP
ncbi:hypothetical protein SAMN05216565_10918 [Litchfieldia salsa]|uniref:Uncharacterized protein n=1 Tax=Litchfieldia salsa TaxID=930152 RepID=A0A1H0W3P1_9BACI|nr:hypothetical protein SAMN05216565_10918 [Litchfieldia salsa]